jgi:hypothetical protein
MTTTTISWSKRLPIGKLRTVLEYSALLACLNRTPRNARSSTLVYSLDRHYFDRTLAALLSTAKLWGGILQVHQKHQRPYPSDNFKRKTGEHGVRTVAPDKQQLDKSPLQCIVADHARDAQIARVYS